MSANAQLYSIEMLQAQHQEISKRLKAAKKAQETRCNLTGSAVLAFIETEPDSQIAKTLVDLLARKITKDEEREAVGIDTLIKKTRSVPVPASA